ncbi:MAG: ATP-binding protein [Bdellovibrionota bacterium]
MGFLGLAAVSAMYLGSLGWIFFRKKKVEGDLKRLEGELQLQALALQRAQTLGKLGIWTWRVSDKHLEWSREFYQILGLSPQEHQPSYELFLDCIHPDDRSQFDVTMQLSMEGVSESRTEFRILTPNKDVRHCSLLCRSEVDALTSNRVVLGILREDTDQKMSEVLRVERDAAKKANHSKSLFLANISHELRTPMHGILSFARFGQQKIETATKEKLKSYFDEILDSGSRLMNLLDDLLDLSKLEAGKIEYRMQEGNLIDVVRSVQCEMATLAEEKGLRFELSHGTPEVIGVYDEQRMTQVVRNLLSNAIKFSDKGTVIRIEFERVPEKILYRVVNKGVGIPALELETVFNKFVQSSKTRTGAGGTGLGLAICREIIQHHNGKIWAESKENGETRFTVEIPRSALKKEESAA